MRLAKRKKTPSRAMANGMRAPVRTVTWRAPRAEMAMPIVSQTAPREPANDCTTSEATCCDCASAANGRVRKRSEEHTSELQSHLNLVCRLLLEKKKKKKKK